MKIIVNSIIPFKGYKAIALWPFIFVRTSATRMSDESWNRMIQHECIHLRQQQELLLVGFYLLYLFLWLWWSMRYRSFHKGYRRVVFEVEAYIFESDNGYLERRKRWSWTKWL